MPVNLMSPMFASNPVMAFAFGVLHDERPNAYENRAAQAQLCRNLAAAQEQARERKRKDAQLEQTDLIVAAEMPRLRKDLEKASAIRVQDHLKDLRYCDLLDATEISMGLKNTVFNRDICDICSEEMEHPTTLPYGGKHQFCERCITGWLERSKHQTCPKCPVCVSAWFQERRAKVCSAGIKKFHRKVRVPIKAAEKKVGIKRPWYRFRVSTEDLKHALDASETA